MRKSAHYVVDVARPGEATFTMHGAWNTLQVQRYLETHDGADGCKLHVRRVRPYDPAVECPGTYSRCKHGRRRRVPVNRLCDEIIARTTPKAFPVIRTADVPTDASVGIYSVHSNKSAAVKAARASTAPITHIIETEWDHGCFLCASIHGPN